MRLSRRAFAVRRAFLSYARQAYGMTDAPPMVELDPEEAQLQRQRVLWLTTALEDGGAGMTVAQAERLARRVRSWHDVRAVRVAGATAEQAFDILS